MSFNSSHAPQLANQREPNSGAAKLRESAGSACARVLLVLALVLLASITLIAAQQGLAAPDQSAAPASQTAPAAEPAPVHIQAPSKPALQLAPRPVTLLLGRGELQQFSDSVSRVAVSEPLIAD